MSWPCFSTCNFCSFGLTNGAVGRTRFRHPSDPPESAMGDALLPLRGLLSVPRRPLFRLSGDSGTSVWVRGEPCDKTGFLSGVILLSLKVLLERFRLRLRFDFPLNLEPQTRFAGELLDWRPYGRRRSLLWEKLLPSREWEYASRLKSRGPDAPGLSRP